MDSNDEDGIIDAEVIESDNLPAVVPKEYASNSEGMELPNRQDTLLQDNPERRCAAHKRNGEQCRKFAIYGATVCRTHGGATRHIKEAARIRVENASNRLMGKLIEFAFDDTKPPDVQLKAIQNSLDRAGLKPPAEVTLSQGQHKPYEDVFDQISTVSRAESRAARGVEDNPTQTLGYEFAGNSGEPTGASVPPASAYDTHASDPSWPESSGTESARESRAHPVDRERGNQAGARHIVGDDALAVAARLAREQRAIESRHKRYLRP